MLLLAPSSCPSCPSFSSLVLLQRHLHDELPQYLLVLLFQWLQQQHHPLECGSSASSHALKNVFLSEHLRVHQNAEPHCSSSFSWLVAALPAYHHANPRHHPRLLLWHHGETWTVSSPRFRPHPHPKSTPLQWTFSFPSSVPLSSVTTLIQGVCSWKEMRGQKEKKVPILQNENTRSNKKCVTKITRKSSSSNNRIHSPPFFY